MAIPTEFNIDFQWRFYLEKMGLKEENLHEVQRKQLKQAFYGACSQLIVLLRDGMENVPPEEGVDILKEMLIQCSNFWTVQRLNQN